MNDFVPGQPYQGADGRLYAWSGRGDANDPAQWSLYSAKPPKSASAQSDEERFTPTSGEFAGVTPAMGRAALKGAGVAAGLALPFLVPEIAGPAGLALRMGANALGGAVAGGSAEGVKGIAPGAVGAAVLGGVGEAAGPLLRAAGRGERLATGIRKTTGIERKIADAIRETRAALKGVSKRLFGPLDRQFAGGVMDNDIMEFINSSPDFVAAARSVSKELIPYTSQLEAGTSTAARGPTVRELQKIRDALLRKGNRDAFDQLTSLMEQKIPGYREANAAYAEQMQIRSARAAGRKMRNASADDIALAREALPPNALKAFQEGQVHEATRSLLMSRDPNAGPIKRLLSMGPEYEERMVEGVFGGDRVAFDKFAGVVRREKSAAKVAAALKALTPWAVGAAGLSVAGKSILNHTDAVDAGTALDRP